MLHKLFVVACLLAPLLVTFATEVTFNHDVAPILYARFMPSPERHCARVVANV